MKLQKCPKCGSTNIKQSACKALDDGYVGYCTCQECYYSVKSNSDLDVIPELWESSYKAKKVAMSLWNDIAKTFPDLTREQASYICGGRN